MNIFLASKDVIQGKAINAVLYADEIWILLNNDEMGDESNLDINDFELYDEELVYERIPAIKGRLNQDEETYVFINEKTGEININPKHKHLGLSSPDDPRATNQANVEISIFKYLVSRKKYFARIIFSVVLTLVFIFAFSWIFLIYLLRILIWNVLAVLNQRDICLSGTLNPAVVVKTMPTKIAVLTDLSMGFGMYPLIRIRKVELPRKYNKLGQRIPIAGSYQNVEGQPFWDFYDPIPLPLGAKTDDVVKNKLKEIPVYEWITLNKNMKLFEKVPKEGYYPIDVESTSWKDIEDPKFSQFNEEQ